LIGACQAHGRGASGGRRLIRAALAADGTGRRFAPAAILLEGPRLVAVERPARIGAVPDATMEDLGGGVILPAFVNAHCHLDLSHVEPFPWDGSFAGWIETVRRRRAADPGAVARAVDRGIALCRTGGTAIVGDIAGSVGGRPSMVPAQRLREAGLAGVSFLEVFGRGPRQDAAAAALREALRDGGPPARGVRLGVSPHAPYSCGPGLYLEAARLGIPAATHLAETPEELRFTAEGAGPIAEFLARIGALDPGEPPAGVHPIDQVAEALAERAFLAAHVNYPQARHLELLCRWRTTVVYCPRASTYFGHPRPGYPPHAYRRMLEAGVNVALGTDGLPCLDTPARISVLDEMRLLYRRDGADPMLLLRLATVGGAQALGFDPALVSLTPGRCAGVLAVPAARARDRDPLAAVLLGVEPPRWLLGPRPLEDAPSP
jgi:cytosine/adenosine deaminase-related metal-dependent hydrolase